MPSFKHAAKHVAFFGKGIVYSGASVSTLLLAIGLSALPAMTYPTSPFFWAFDPYDDEIESLLNTSGDSASKAVDNYIKTFSHCQ